MRVDSIFTYLYLFQSADAVNVFEPAGARFDEDIGQFSSLWKSDLDQSTVDQSDPNQLIDSRLQKLKVLVRSYPEFQRLESQLELQQEISANKCTGAVWRKTATSSN